MDVQFKEGDLVCWSYKQTKIPGCRGRVCGVASSELPIMGRMYIIKLNMPLTEDLDYPYSCLVVPEHCLSREHITPVDTGLCDSCGEADDDLDSNGVCSACLESDDYSSRP
jgi:hypothetical protein